MAYVLYILNQNIATHFLSGHHPPWYSWNIVESCVKHHNPNPLSGYWWRIKLAELLSAVPGVG